MVAGGEHTSWKDNWMKMYYPCWSGSRTQNFPGQTPSHLILCVRSCQIGVVGCFLQPLAEPLSTLRRLTVSVGGNQEGTNIFTSNLTKKSHYFRKECRDASYLNQENPFWNADIHNTVASKGAFRNVTYFQKRKKTQPGRKPSPLFLPTHLLVPLVPIYSIPFSSFCLSY